MPPTKHLHRIQEIKIDKPAFSRNDTTPDEWKNKRFSMLRITMYSCIFCIFFVICVLVGLHGMPLVKQHLMLTEKMEIIATGQYHQLLSAPLVLQPGMNIQILALRERLEALGYKQGNNTHLFPGEYLDKRDRFFLYPARKNPTKQRLLVLDITNQEIELISEVKNGTVVPEIQLGRICLTSFLDTVWEIRYPVKYQDYPQSLIAAVLSAEDKNFFSHHGVAPRSILRAAWVNLWHGKVVQGGSTITQQLVKMLTLRQGRGFKDKVYEAILAVVLELHYSKEEILSAYLNTLYLGQVGPFAIHGMGAAAKILLGTELTDLTVRQSALLAGIIRGPNSLSPLSHPEKAESRAQTVLDQMHRNGSLEQPLLMPVNLSEIIKPVTTNLLSRAWYIQQVEKELAGIDRYEQQRNKRHGLQIALGLDPYMQEQAQQILNSHLDNLEQRKHLPLNSLQGAVVTLDQRSGVIRALVGGRNYLDNQFNRASSANRQIGSLIKPFVYLSAMIKTADTGRPLTQATLIRDTPLRLKVGSKPWRPRNFDRRFKGTMTLRKALADSRNIPAVRMGLKAGVEQIRGIIRALGINKEPASGPALFLGAVESTPLKMAAAYAALANGGIYMGPTMIEKIIWQDQLFYQQPAGKQLFKAKDTYVITDMLQEVFEHGTAKSAKKYNLRTPVAGKTGTSNNLRDGWFAGYSPNLVTVVWVGRDNNRKMGLTGAASGLPVWGELMAKYGEGIEDVFAVPGGVEFATVSLCNGKKSSYPKKDTSRMAFVRGTVPSTTVYRQVAAIRKQLQKQTSEVSSSMRQRYKYFR